MKLKIFLIFALAIAGLTYFTSKKTQDMSSGSSPKEVIISELDIQASFTIYTHQTLRFFSDPKYHNLSPDVYIEADNPSLIKVKKQGTTWGDFFSTLPMKLTNECLTTGTGQTFCTGDSGTLRFFVNGVENPNALTQTINPSDKLLVTFGTEVEGGIDKQLNQAQ